MIAAEVKMAQILVRNVDDRLKSELQRRARRNKRSMEGEVREILYEALRQPEPRASWGRRSSRFSAGRVLASKKGRRFRNSAASRWSQSLLTNDPARLKRYL